MAKLILIGQMFGMQKMKKELKPGGACIVSASCTEYKCQDIDSGRFREKRLAMSYIQSARMNALLADSVYRDLPIGVIDREQLKNKRNSFKSHDASIGEIHG